MAIYYLMTANGSTPPRFQHYDLDLAIAEAKRLHEIHNTSVTILKVIGSVKTVEVPVTRKEVKVTIDEPQGEDLPF